MANVIAEFNEISEYAKSFPTDTSFKSTDTRFDHSDLATFENTSSHNYKRNRNKKDLNNDHVHQCSLQIVRNASEQPIKYLCKYFNIPTTNESLTALEEINDNLSKRESTVNNLNERVKQIEDDFNPPKFILKHYKEELMEKLNVDIPKITFNYPTYVFKYVSPGGNSSQKSTIKFDLATVEATEEYISKALAYKKSAKAQRAIMTQKKREEIKKRDNYTCKLCGASTAEQSLLLLEVDHIIPVSKGGLSTPDNLQTLCWKCNRSKSNKIM